MTTKLLCTFETATNRAFREKQYSVFASNSKVLTKLILFEAIIKNKYGALLAILRRL